MLPKVDDSIHTKDKMVTQLLQQVKSIVNTFEFGQIDQLIPKLNWEELVELKGGNDAFKPTGQSELDLLNAQVDRIDH